MLITHLINSYRKIMNLLLKISFYAVPIISGVVSAVSAHAVSRNVGATLGGFVVGAILGFIGAVVVAFIIVPPVLVLFEVNENLVKIYKEVKKDEPKSVGTQSSVSKTETEKVDVKSGWECPNCGAFNAVNNTRCVACYKSR